jgi:hypothetical protein
MKKQILIILFFFLQTALWANSVNLFNNSQMQLRAVILSADGQLLDEVVLNSRDASTWADDLYQFGYNPASTHAPYTVNWYCMGGKLFGTCKNVASGSIVLAQNCTLGSSECPGEDEE